MKKITEIFSYFWGIRVKKIKSPLNGTLEVWYISGHHQLDAENVNYSFGSLHRLFRKVFNETALRDRKPESMLILGLGAGSIVSILRDELRMATRITGIEHDPGVIELARKYFEIGRFSGLEIICRDAMDYVSEESRKYDVIVIDLFHDQKVPDKFQSELFLHQVIRHLENNGLLIYNYIVKTKKEQTGFDSLADLFKAYPGKLNILEVFGTNKILVYSQKTSNNSINK